ncbi:MAG: NosD domain-containing protein [Candidatus Nanoarchaeia archaeon]
MENNYKKKVKHLVDARLCLIILFLVIIVLYIGNIAYPIRMTGKAIDDANLFSEKDSEVAYMLHSNQIQSNVNVMEKINASIKEGTENAGVFENKNKLIEFEDNQSSISLYFELLNSSDISKVIEADDFQISLYRGPEKYKWGYNLTLNQLDFFARIDVYSSEPIIKIDNQTIKIQNSYISFADLVQSGYNVSLEMPEVIFNEPNQEAELGSSSLAQIINLAKKIFIDPLSSTSAFVLNGIRGISGFAIKEQNNKVSFYISKNFTNEHQIGDAITLDPVLIVLETSEDDSEFIDGNIIYRCGKINQSGVFFINQSITFSGSCFNIAADDVHINGNGYTLEGDSTGQDYGVYVNSRKNISIDNMNIRGFYYGAYFYSVNYSLLKNTGFSYNDYGAYIDSSSGNTLSENVFSLNRVNFYINGKNSKDFNNSIDSSNMLEDFYRIYYNVSVSEYTFNSGNSPNAGAVMCIDCTNVTYRDINTIQGNFAGIYFFNTQDSVVINSTFNSGEYGAFLDSSRGNKFSNCSLSENNLYDVSLKSSSDNVFLNSNYSTEEVDENSLITRKWLYSLHLNDSEGNNIEGAGINAYNAYGELEFELTSDSYGNTQIKEISEYRNDQGVIFYYSPYTIFASKDGYLDITSLWDVSYEKNNKQELEFNKLNLTRCSKLYNANSVYTLESNLYSDESCINITAQNITLDCKGKSIVYGQKSSSDAYYGIYSDKFNTSIINCIVTSGGPLSYTQPRYGVYFFKANNSNIINNSLNNQYNGAVLKNTYYAKSRNNIIQENNHSGVFLEYSDYNSFSLDNSRYNGRNGFELYNSSSNILENVYGNYNIDKGIMIYNSVNNSINNSKFNYNSNNGGIQLSYSSYNNFYSTEALNNSNYGAWLGLYSKNNYFYNFSPSSSSGNLRGVYISDYSNNNVFEDSELDYFYQNYDVYTANSCTNNSFLSSYYNLSKEYVASSCSLARKWHYKAYARDNAFNPIAGARLIAYNKYGAVSLNITTDEYGFTSPAEVIEYTNIGGKREYYSNYIFAMSFNSFYWDSHQHNFTILKNKIDDNFILEQDIKAPSISGVTWYSNANSVTLIWSTDEASNSSVSYWGSSSGKSDNNIPAIEHTIEITGLLPNSTYYFTYSSCDFAGNCNSSSTQNFRTSESSGIVSGSSLGGNECIPNIKCSFGECINNTRIKACIDDNNCGPYYNSSIEDCVYIEGLSAKAMKINDTNASSIKKELPSASKNKLCTPQWVCSPWSECRPTYYLESLVNQKVLLKGEKHRTCTDKNNCYEHPEAEISECETKIPIYAKRVNVCQEEYIEIYSLDNKIIARMKEKAGNFEKLDIQVIFDSAAYCPYCYNGIRDYNEDDIDCTNDGKDCPGCEAIKSTYSLKNYSIYKIMFFIIGLSIGAFIWVLFKEFRDKDKYESNTPKIESRYERENFDKKPKKFFAVFFGIMLGLIIVFGIIYVATKQNNFNYFYSELSSYSFGFYKILIGLAALLFFAVIFILIKIFYIVNEKKKIPRQNDSGEEYKRLKRNHRLLLPTYYRMEEERKKIFSVFEENNNNFLETGGSRKERTESFLEKQNKKYISAIDKLNELKNRIEEIEARFGESESSRGLFLRIDDNIDKLKQKLNYF